MIGRRLVTLWIPTLTVLFLALLLLSAQLAEAQTETVLYSFTNTPDGAGPYSQLVYKNGNLYGTTYQGGASGAGTVFEVTTAGTEKVLYNFGSQTGDGAIPFAGVIFGKKGILYGTTPDGGASGVGTVFELTPKGKETVLYSFGSFTGYESCILAGLTSDKKGNLYGTTCSGGTYGNGTVFEVTAQGAYEHLYSFGSQAGDGVNPFAGVVFDKIGNLYGTTYYGGAYNLGTVFEVTTSGTEKVLYSFGSQSNDGNRPQSGLTFDKKGNLYGTTEYGGAYNLGTVFELTATGTENVLYSFGSQSGDGAYPYLGSLTFGKKGILYGTTPAGGANNLGTVFELPPKGTEIVLYSFGSQAGDGQWPYANVTFDKTGNLYGTTYKGGADGSGTVFKLTP